MNEGTLLRVKSSLQKFYILCDTYDDAMFNMKETLPGCSLKRALLVSTAEFLMYLSASDGRVEEAEVDFLNLLFDGTWTVQSLAQFINEKTYIA